MAATRIIKSPTDYKKYDSVKLKNGIEALLISDTKAQISRINVIVKTGSCFEGKMHGLAHFLEHMLFIGGNSKCKSGDEYFNFVNINGGHTNAHTGSIETVYELSIMPEKFAQAMDIMSHFFIDPIFTDSKMDNEISSIHSEYQKNMGIHAFQLSGAMRALCKPGHPYGEFHVGSTQTLKNASVKKNLIKFFNKYYVSENIKLVVIEPKNMEMITRDIIAFENVKHGESSAPIQDEPFEYFNIIRMVSTISGQNNILFILTIPYEGFQDVGLINYLSHVISRKTRGSLYDILVSKLLALGVDFNVIDRFGKNLIASIGITIGYDQMQKMDTIIGITLKYLEEIKKFNDNHFDIFKKCGKLKFEFDDQHNINELMDSITDRMILFNGMLQQSATIGVMMSDYGKDIPDRFRNLINLHKINIIACSDVFKSVVNTTHRWFRFEYSIDKIVDVIDAQDVSTLAAFNNIYYYDRNLIPEKLEVYKSKHNYNIPEHVNCLFNVWFNYERGETPRVCVILKFNVYDIDKTVTDYIGANLSIITARKRINDLLYDTRLYGVEYSIHIINDDIYIELCGLNGKVPEMIKIILTNTFNTSMTLNELQYSKMLYKMHLEQYINDPPYKLVEQLTNKLFFKKYYLPIEQLKSVDSIQLNTINSIKFSKIIDVKCIINGNATKKMSLAICQIISDNTNLYDSGILPSTLKTPDNTTVMSRKGTPDKNVSNSVIFYANEMMFKSPLFLFCYSMFLLINKILSDKFFSASRIDKQVGYIVNNKLRMYHGLINVILTLQLTIQSAEYETGAISEHINMFINDMYTFIKGLSHDKFNEYKTSCAAELRRNETDLYEKTVRLFGAIVTEIYDFEYRSAIANLIENVTLEKLIVFYHDNFIDLNAPKLIINIE